MGRDEIETNLRALAIEHYEMRLSMSETVAFVVSSLEDHRAVKLIEDGWVPPSPPVGQRHA